MTTIAEEKPFVLTPKDLGNIWDVNLLLSRLGWGRLVGLKRSQDSGFIHAHYCKQNRHGIVVYDEENGEIIFTKYLRFVRLSETDIIVRSIPE